MAAEATVTKGEFAKLCNVSPGRVTQWIAERKISGKAIVGEGRSARIRVDLAQRQLRLRRDVGQAHGNGAATKLKQAAPAPGPSPTPDLDSALRYPDPSDEVDAAIKRARLEAIERNNRTAAAEEAASQGRYTETAAARAEMGRIAGQVIRTFEGAIPDIATALAASFKLDARDVTHRLQEQFRKVREKAAEKAAQAAAAQPALLPEGGE